MMKQVFCPSKGVQTFGNLTSKGALRCVKCGSEHSEAKKFVTDFEPTKTSSKKKFKKGGKSKGKKKGEKKA